MFYFLQTEFFTKNTMEFEAILLNQKILEAERLEFPRELSFIAICFLRDGDL